MNDDVFAATATVRLRRSSEVVTAVPFLLGFTPAECLVVLVLAEGRVVVTARLDLPTPGEVPSAVAALTRTLAHVRVGEVIVVGYGDEDTVTPAVAGVVALLGWPVREVLRVQDGRWWSLTCADPTCCPPGALVPVDDVVSTALLVATGSPAPSRADLAAVLQPGLPRVVAAVRAALDVVPVLTSTQLYAAVRAARRARQDRPAGMDAAQVAVLLHAVRDVMVRDACCVWTDQAALNLWLDLVPLAPHGWVAPVATLLAVTAYQRGDGALAVLALERATAEAPAYTLARLLDQLIALGIPPATLTHLLEQAARDNPLTASRSAD